MWKKNQPCPVGSSVSSNVIFIESLLCAKHFTRSNLFNPHTSLRGKAQK